MVITTLNLFGMSHTGDLPLEGQEEIRIGTAFCGSHFVLVCFDGWYVSSSSYDYDVLILNEDVPWLKKY